jgi:hypothetical protein
MAKSKKVPFKSYKVIEIDRVYGSTFEPFTTLLIVEFRYSNPYRTRVYQAREAGWTLIPKAEQREMVAKLLRIPHKATPLRIEQTNP